MRGGAGHLNLAQARHHDIRSWRREISNDFETKLLIADLGRLRLLDSGN